jgi:hypothetical protein
MYMDKWFAKFKNLSSFVGIWYQTQNYDKQDRKAYMAFF